MESFFSSPDLKYYNSSFDEVERLTNFQPLPFPTNFKSYSDFNQSIELWFSSTQNLTENVRLPIPQSAFIRYPQMKPEAIKRPTQKNGIPLSPINRLLYQRILLEGIEIGEQYPEVIDSRPPILVQNSIQKTFSWTGILNMSPPDPNDYNTFEEYEEASIKWFTITNERINSPEIAKNTAFHPSELQDYMNITKCQVSRNIIQKNTPKITDYRSFSFPIIYIDHIKNQSDLEDPNYVSDYKEVIETKNISYLCHCLYQDSVMIPILKKQPQFFKNFKIPNSKLLNPIDFENAMKQASSRSLPSRNVRRKEKEIEDCHFLPIEEYNPQNIINNFMDSCMFETSYSDMFYQRMISMIKSILYPSPIEESISPKRLVFLAHQYSISKSPSFRFNFYQISEKFPNLSSILDDESFNKNDSLLFNLACAFTEFGRVKAPFHPSFYETALDMIDPSNSNLFPPELGMIAFKLCHYELFQIILENFSYVLTPKDKELDKIKRMNISAGNEALLSLQDNSTIIYNYSTKIIYPPQKDNDNPNDQTFNDQKKIVHDYSQLISMLLCSGFMNEVTNIFLNIKPTLFELLNMIAEWNITDFSFFSALVFARGERIQLLFPFVESYISYSNSIKHFSLHRLHPQVISLFSSLVLSDFQTDDVSWMVNLVSGSIHEIPWDYRGAEVTRMAIRSLALRGVEKKDMIKVTFGKKRKRNLFIMDNEWQRPKISKKLQKSISDIVPNIMDILFICIKEPKVNIGIFKAFRTLMKTAEAYRFLQFRSSWIPTLLEKMTYAPEMFRVEAWHIFRTYIMCYPNDIEKYTNDPIIRKNLIEALHHLTIQTSLEAILLIANYALRFVEVDTINNNAQGFVFLLSGIPNQFLQLADIFNEAGFTLMKRLHTISKRKNNPPKIQLKITRAKKILSQRNSCKQLFNGNMGDQIKENLKKSSRV